MACGDSPFLASFGKVGRVSSSAGMIDAVSVRGGALLRVLPFRVDAIVKFDSEFPFECRKT